MISLEGANAYHAARLGKEAWEEESANRRERALASAIDDLAAFTSARGYEGAIYEQALWLLGSEAELARDRVTGFSLPGISKSYDRGKRPSHIAPKAWTLLSGSTVKTGEMR